MFTLESYNIIMLKAENPKNILASLFSQNMGYLIMRSSEVLMTCQRFFHFSKSILWPRIISIGFICMSVVNVPQRYGCGR